LQPQQASEIPKEIVTRRICGGALVMEATATMETAQIIVNTYDVCNDVEILRDEILSTKI
jgi:hypothetical protein